ncbi:MAG: ribonuclease H-like domain-containing protein [Candidatus Bipolaricaulota bacterium]
MNLSPLAVDIETVGKEWDKFDQETRDYLLNRGKKDQTKEEIIEKLALGPGTGRIVAIGMWRPKEDKGGVLLEAKNNDETSDQWENMDNGDMIYRGSESQMLEEFWRYISQGVSRLITFNGRSFDGPFLMLRSAILRISPTRSFSPYRYSFRRHCDLAEVVSFFGARRLKSLDFWCRQAGVESPKKGLDGSKVGEAYRNGEIEKIGRYCLEDVRATAELFNVLEPVIEVLEKEL